MVKGQAARFSGDSGVCVNRAKSGNINVLEPSWLLKGMGIHQGTLMSRGWLVLTVCTDMDSDTYHCVLCRER